MIFNPYLLGGAAIAALLSFGGGLYYGNKYTAESYQGEIATMKLNAAHEAQKIRDAMTAQADSAIASLETKNAAARVVYRTITQQVDRVVEMPLYRDRCLDDPGLRLANLALGGVTVAPSAVASPDSGMPTSLKPQ